VIMAKERLEFCKNAKCARVTINTGDAPPIILISKAPTLILEVESKEPETFTHEMTAPMQRSFSDEILGIENIGGFWYFNNTGGSDKLDCPMPGTYPASVPATGVNRNLLSDLYWEKDRLFCFFDRAGAYFNNLGSCSYKVNFIKRYTFFDQQGILYENRPSKNLQYKVECDACCKDDEILCDSNHYPGYTCYPIAPVQVRLLAGKNDIARFWR